MINKHKDIIWGIGFMAVLALGITIIALAGNRDNQNSPLASTAPAQEWTTGGAAAKVTLIEYSDFQCPACAAYYPLVEQLKQDFGDQIKFTYRHFPLRQSHQNAEPAAKAAEAAGRQGKFWEMYSLLFQNQTAWAESSEAETMFENYAAQLGLNLEQFQTDVDAKEVKQKIEADYLSGLASRVSGTPTFFLNGRRLNNPRNYEQFKTLITEELAKN